MPPSPVLPGRANPKIREEQCRGHWGPGPQPSREEKRWRGHASFETLLRARLEGGSDYEPRTGSVEMGEINCGASLPNVLL